MAGKQWPGSNKQDTQGQMDQRPSGKVLTSHKRGLSGWGNLNSQAEDGEPILPGSHRSHYMATITLLVTEPRSLSSILIWPHVMGGGGVTGAFEQDPVCRSPVASSTSLACSVLFFLAASPARKRAHLYKT